MRAGGVCVHGECARLQVGVGSEMCVRDVCACSHPKRCLCGGVCVCVRVLVEVCRWLHAVRRSAYQCVERCHEKSSLLSLH